MCNGRMLSLSVCLSVSHSKGRGAGADGDGWKGGREGKDYFRDDDDDVNNSCHRKGETSSPKLAKEAVKARRRQRSTKRWWWRRENALQRISQEKWRDRKTFFFFLRPHLTYLSHWRSIVRERGQKRIASTF